MDGLDLKHTPTSTPRDAASRPSTVWRKAQDFSVARDISKPSAKAEQKTLSWG